MYAQSWKNCGLGWRYLDIIQHTSSDLNLNGG